MANDLVYQWTIQNINTDQILALDIVNDKYYLDLPAGTLQLGSYSVTLLAYVSGTYGTDHSSTIYLNIEPTPLEVGNLNYLYCKLST